MKYVFRKCELKHTILPADLIVSCLSVRIPVSKQEKTLSLRM